MTRAQFLKLLAAVPAARLSAQSQWPAPKSGSLLVVCGGLKPRVLLDGRGISEGKRAPFLLAPDRLMAFLAYVAHPAEDNWQSYLTTLDLSKGGIATDYPYPGPVSSRGVSMAVSLDGAWLYTLTGRERGGHHSSSEGGLHPEMAVIYTFDIRNSQFLPQATEGPEEFSEGMTVVSDSNFRHVAVGPFSTGTFESVLIADNGKATWEHRSQDKGAKILAPGTYQLVFSPDRSGFLYIMPSGEVYRMAIGSGTTQEPARGGVDALAPDRWFGRASSSGDGGLLFLPSGPLRISDPYRFRYLDRIAVYRSSDLHKLRELSSQRPWRLIQASLDGSKLYATGANFNQISILDAETLWEEGTMEFPGSSVENFSVLP